MPVEDPRQCIGQCAEAPVCGRQTIPENHLKVQLMKSVHNLFNLRNLQNSQFRDHASAVYLHT